MNIIENIRTFFVNILEWIKGAFSIAPAEIIDPEVAFIAKLDTKDYTYDEDKKWYVEHGQQIMVRKVVSKSIKKMRKVTGKS